MTIAPSLCSHIVQQAVENEADLTACNGVSPLAVELMEVEGFVYASFGCIPRAEPHARQRRDHGDYLGPKKPPQKRHFQKGCLRTGHVFVRLFAVELSVEAASG